MKKMKKGFTLIELMIVVAIIGVLAAVAIPKFADLIRKANEAACKGQLGAMRSALSIYYGNMEGIWPSSLTEITPTYIQAIPNAKPGCPNMTRADSATVQYQGAGATGCTGTNDGGWWFNNGKSSVGLHTGVFCVNSTKTDTKTTMVHLW
ncbi:MAG: hypothetical protein CVU78_01065 [Elusimicrobia bacterium HGW-Elusimicrobia-2]|nr:MAG: hypothetical protein CVU78_01065 [Elusimicrobia bacterium HGW-Elusimicrobia-2]